MKLVLDIFFFLMITFFCYHYIQVLLKLKQKVIFPVTDAELAGIRKRPEKLLRAPTFQKQTAGIIFCGCLLGIVIVFYLLGIYYDMTELTFYFMMILILSYATFALNVFALNKAGIISGARFIPWKQIKSFQFIPIDMNHKFYGYSKEVNDGYELKIRGRGATVNCLITNEEIKNKLESLLEGKVKAS